jgi:hypothetical protein
MGDDGAMSEQPGDDVWSRPSGGPSGEYGAPEPGGRYAGSVPAAPPAATSYAGTGYGAPPPYGAPGGGSPTRNGTGTAALVLGIIGLVLSLFLIGGLIGIVAVILGVVGRRLAKRGEAANPGVALSGLILGIVAILVSATVVFAFVVLSNTYHSYVDCVRHASGDQTRIEQCNHQLRQQIDHRR